MGEEKRGRDKRCLSSSSSLSLRKRRGNKGHRDFRLTRMVDSPLINRSEETKRTGLDAVAHQSDKRSFRGKSINTSYATVSPSARDRFRSICLCPKRIRRDKPWQNTALPLPVSFPPPFFGKDFVTPSCLLIIQNISKKFFFLKVAHGTMYTEILAPTSNNNYHKDPDPSDLSRSSTVNYKIEIVHLASCHLSHSPFDILNSSLSLSIKRVFGEAKSRGKRTARVSADNFMAHRVGMSRMDGN